MVDYIRQSPRRADAWGWYWLDSWEADGERNVQLHGQRERQRQSCADQIGLTVDRSCTRQCGTCTTDYHNLVASLWNGWHGVFAELDCKWWDSWL